MERAVSYFITALACLTIVPEQAHGRDCLECWREVCAEGSFNGDSNFLGDCCDCVESTNCITTLTSAHNSTDCCSIAEDNLINMSSDSDACSSSNDPYLFTSVENLLPQSSPETLVPATYVVPSFRFDCSGCIEEVQLQAEIENYNHPNPIIVRLDLLTWFHRIDEDIEDGEDDSLYILSHNISLTANESNIAPESADMSQLTVTFSLSNDNQLCFNENEELGFSSSELFVILNNHNEGLVYEPVPSNDDICPNLNKFHTTVTASESKVPLIAVRIVGHNPSPSVSLSSMAKTLSSTTTTITHFSSTKTAVNTPLPTLTEPTFDTSTTSFQEVLSPNIVIGVSVGVTIPTISSIIGIFSCILYMIWRSKKGNDKVDGSGHGITRVRSQRLERRLHQNSSGTELLPMTGPVYDYPHAQVHPYHELEGPTPTEPELNPLVLSGNYTAMQPAGSIREGAMTPMLNGAVNPHSIYDDEPPLNGFHEGAPQLPPPRMQEKPFYHVLEDPGNVTQIGYDDPVELLKKKGGEDEIVNPIYNEIVAGPQQHLQMVDPSTGHPYHMLESGEHWKVGEPETVEEHGVYVPTAEERRRICNNDTTTELENWVQKNRLESTKKKHFFETLSTYWQPPSDADSLYNTLAQRKYREILADQIQIVKFIGSGQFGTVNLAVWTQQFLAPMDVAVKVCRAGKNEAIKTKFLKEAAIMGQFRHPNVVKLYGVVTMSELPMIVLELMKNGDMLDYMKKNFEPGRLPPPSPNRLHSFSMQVASGMEYLSSKAFVHRDLAARNILLNELHQCKIGDFGMARDLEDSEYYIMSRKGPQPFKWTAPEALNFRKYSTFSDCYSYGMVLYEIWSVGREPLPGISIKKVPDLVTKGFCQPPPPGCPRAIYELMVKLWNPKKRSRPTFPDIVKYLKQPDEELLGWTEEDRAVSSQAAVLGAPLEEGNQLYPLLQNAYQSSWC